MGLVRKIKAGLVKKTDIDQFIGEDGNIFFDVDDGTFRLSDGETPGGLLLGSGGGGGATSFRQLSDTPSSYSGNGGGYLKVNAEGTAIEFVQETPFSGSYNDLSDKPSLFDPSSVGQSIVPDTDEAYDLGTETLKWRDLYLSGNSIFLGTARIRNVDGSIELPGNAKVNGRKIPVEAADLVNLLDEVDGGEADSLPDAS